MINHNIELVQGTLKDLPFFREILEMNSLPSEDIEGKEELLYKVYLDSNAVGLTGLEVHGNYGLLRSVVVNPERREKGVGSAIVEEMKAIARTSGLTDLYLLTTTAPLFFEKTGFRRIAREEVPEAVLQAEEFKSICPASAVVMHFPLA